MAPHVSIMTCTRVSLPSCSTTSTATPQHGVSQRNLPKLKVPRCMLTLADEVFSVVELDGAVFLLEDGLQLVVQVGERHRVGRHDLRCKGSCLSRAHEATKRAHPGSCRVGQQ